ncbi:MAG TPA: Gfo/Idh/MocA family oxidoreductase [Firmicutes bacterium]|nr:Gfo/Idh/MocA family oxidoreductase [Bacillota bacterium]
MMRVGVIGVGVMGRHHARILSEIRGVDLVGVCDTERSRADEVASLYGTIPFYYPGELLRQGLDAVHVVTPTFIHHDIAEEAIDSGCHVLIEKPIADTLSNGQSILRMAKHAGVILMVGHIERFNPAIRRLKELTDTGRLGKLISVSTLRVAPYPQRIVDTGIIVDLGCHDIDIMAYLTGSRVREVYCTASSTIHHLEDTASISLLFNNGNRGHIETSWLSKIKARKLFATFEAGFVLVDFIEQSLIVYDDQRATEIEVQKAEPLREEIVEFVRCVREKDEPHIGGEASIHALGVALAAVTSGHLRLPLYIKGENAMDFTPELAVNGSET